MVDDVYVYVYVDDVEPRTFMVHYLRERLGKTGTVVGCKEDARLITGRTR